MRTASIQRKTKETDIKVEVGLDGPGRVAVKTGIGFFDHMLDLVAKHGALTLKVTAKGDLGVDFHHTVEDVGICLGRGVKQALGDKAGIRRYGTAIVPMDEALVMAAVDVSGRAHLSYKLDLRRRKVRDFEAELVEEFFRAVVNAAGMNLHLRQLAGRNTHHLIEAAFKAFARALREAVESDPRSGGVPSTKGTL
ncbi:MAG: imidazoleglycerol-phosphate dehydratase HisB [Armatimonadota bacterium]|nr:MAG: imidazoleglycerol-phosphate dehydratase HisB [Armatimonadota bacterium]